MCLIKYEMAYKSIKYALKTKNTQNMHLYAKLNFESSFVKA
jgi:hypothetical protein